MCHKTVPLTISQSSESNRNFTRSNIFSHASASSTKLLIFVRNKSSETNASRCNEWLKLKRFSLRNKQKYHKNKPQTARVVDNTNYWKLWLMMVNLFQCWIYESLNFDRLSNFFATLARRRCLAIFDFIFFIFCSRFIFKNINLVI
jgi:hypothetical protein